MRCIVTLTALAILAGAGAAWCGQPQAGHVFRRVEVEATGRTAPVRAAFESFYSEYAAGLEPLLRRERIEGWEFWVVLRRDPKQNNRPHILVLGRSGGLLVRLADIAVAKPVNTAGEVTRAIRASMAAAADPTFRQWATHRRPAVTPSRASN